MLNCAHALLPNDTMMPMGQQCLWGTGTGIVNGVSTCMWADWQLTAASSLPLHPQAMQLPAQAFSELCRDKACRAGCKNQLGKCRGKTITPHSCLVTRVVVVRP